MMMRRLTVLTAMLALTAACASMANAQERGRGGRGGFGMGGGGMTMLASMKPVQEELKLTADQTAAVTKLGEAAMTTMRESFQNLRDASPEERTAAREKMAKLSAENDKKIAEILKPEQTARLKELSLQSRGVVALTDPEVATALKLTDDQKTKLTELAAANRPGQGGGGGGGGGAGAGASDEERAAARERMTKARAERLAKALEVLTAEQREQFTKMQGKKFDFPAPQGRPGAGARNGGGQRQRANT